jgi:hypothetical protein
VEQSLGNLHRPLSDTQLEEKFREQALLVLPAAGVDTLVDMCWQIDQLTDVGELVAAAVPDAAPAATR